jgi:hypothetical protein
MTLDASRRKDDRKPPVRTALLFGDCGEACESTGARHSMSLISVFSTRGHMRFMIKQQGGDKPVFSSKI